MMYISKIYLIKLKTLKIAVLMIFICEVFKLYLIAYLLANCVEAYFEYKKYKSNLKPILQKRSQKYLICWCKFQNFFHVSK